MISDKLKISIQCSCQKARKAINKMGFSLKMFGLNLSQAKTSNNKRKMNGKPMIRKQAYVRNYKNRRKRM